MSEQFSYSFKWQQANETITNRCFTDIDTARKQAQDEFGISFGDGCDESGTIPYCLIGPVDITSGNFSLQSLSETCQQIRSVRSTTRINLLTYFDVELGIDPEFNPPAFDKEHRVNTIYPDEIIDGWRGPSRQDIFDNIICETIRAKYIPTDATEEFDSELKQAQIGSQAIIAQISRLFNDYQLFHRAPTDGAVLITSEPGLLISRMRTKKTKLQASDFSLVTSYDVIANEIGYAGSGPPSSDSPELLILAELLEAEDKLPQLAIHFHHPTLTRSGKLSNATSSHEIEYGRFTSGSQIYGELQRINQPWIILKHHGFLWIGNTVNEFEQFIKTTLKLKPIT